MIDTLKQYKAFGKFVEWMKQLEQSYILDDFLVLRYCYGENTHIVINNRELLSLLVEFCDSEGYIILLGFGSKWFWEIQDNNNAEEYTNSYKTFDSRTEATKAAIVKCFELMESENG